MCPLTIFRQALWIPVTRRVQRILIMTIWEDIQHQFWKGLKRELTSLPFDRYAKFLPWTILTQTIYRDSRGTHPCECRSIFGAYSRDDLSKQTTSGPDLRDLLPMIRFIREVSTIARWRKRSERYLNSVASRDEFRVAVYLSSLWRGTRGEHFESDQSLDDAFYDPLPNPLHR